MRRLAYKPVVLANADKLIVGQRVEPSNEILAIEPMVEQHHAVFGTMPPTLGASMCCVPRDAQTAMATGKNARR